jgi:hypothetical protein
VNNNHTNSEEVEGGRVQTKQETVEVEEEDTATDEMMQQPVGQPVFLVQSDSAKVPVQVLSTRDVNYESINCFVLLSSFCNI